VIWAERAVTGTVPDSALWAMARTAHAYSLGKAGQVAEGLTVLDFLPPSANDVPRTEIDALIMRGMLKVYVDDLSGAIADLGAAAARLRSGVPATYPVPCLSHLSEAHFRRGDWDTALTYARLATSLAQDADRPWIWPGRTHDLPRCWPVAVSGLPQQSGSLLFARQRLGFLWCWPWRPVRWPVSLSLRPAGPRRYPGGH